MLVKTAVKFHTLSRTLFEKRAIQNHYGWKHVPKHAHGQKRVNLYAPLPIVGA